MMEPHAGWRVKLWKFITPGAAIGVAAALVWAAFVYRSDQVGQDRLITSNRAVIHRLDVQEDRIVDQIRRLKAEAQIRCDEEQGSRAALRRVLTFAQAFSLANNKLSAEQRRLTIQFYSGALKLVPPIDC